MNNVSVIVPIYNAGEKLNKCIKSIINQSFKHIEILLINDGSTDNSLNICKKYEEKDNRIKVINKSNEGSIKTRKRGIDESKGEYIIFVDADDWIKSNMIELLYNSIKKENSDIVVCKITQVIGKKGLIRRDFNSNLKKYSQNKKNYYNEEIRDVLAKSFLFSGGFPSSVFAKIYRKNLLIDSGKYTQKINFFGDDLYLNLEVFLKSKKITIINKKLYYYRNGGGTSKYMTYYFEDLINGYEIKENVISEYYEEFKNDEYLGLYNNLIDAFKSCLINLMYS